MRKHHRIVVALIVSVSLPIVGCTLITEVDRSLIDSDSGGAGGDTADGSSAGGDTATGGSDNLGGSSGSGNGGEGNLGGGGGGS